MVEPGLELCFLFIIYIQVFENQLCDLATSFVISFQITNIDKVFCESFPIIYILKLIFKTSTE